MIEGMGINLVRIIDTSVGCVWQLGLLGVVCSCGCSDLSRPGLLGLRAGEDAINRTSSSRTYVGAV